MAYVAGFENDIFISYAHVDDIPMPGVQDGWVTTLVSCIRTRLSQRLGRSDSFKIWMDYELSHHTKITPQIMDALHKTAIMIIVLSPGYISSEWCQREKNSFMQFIKESDSRIFVVERDFVEPNDRPSEFNDLTGYRFWLCEQEGKPIRILGDPEPKNDHDYYMKVDALAREMEKELRNLKKIGQCEQITSCLEKQPDQPKVFLAEATDDLELERNNVRNYLNQAGIDVLPVTCYSQEPNSFKQAVGRDLASCEIFVQLLSNVAGKKPPDLPQGYVGLQLELAKAAHKKILQWRSPLLDVSSILDEEHRALVDGETVRAEGIEDFKRAVKEAIFLKPKPASQQSLNTLVFVNMESADRPLAEKVCTYLDQHDIGYTLPLDDGDPSAIREIFVQNLMDSNGIIIIYGSSTVVWVHRQLLECRKILAQREKPLQAFAVFEGPPEEKSAIPLKLPNLQVLNFRKGVDDVPLQTELNMFVHRLQEGI